LPVFRPVAAVDTNEPLGMSKSGISDPMGMNTGMIFYSRVTSVPDLNRDGTDIFSHPTDTRYFTTAIILGCKQVKIYSFCYINYDLF
jgi:hypothetical protein